MFTISYSAARLRKVAAFSLQFNLGKFNHMLLEKKEILRNVFNEVDPAGIYLDENTDEYDAEINELIAMDIDFSDISKLNEALSLIFKKYFDNVHIEDRKLNELANKVLELKLC